jgi:ABC-type nickel/cobalt efflux system permease component RcnA
MMFFLAGLVAGVAHVLSGPDHLAAIAPLAFNRAKRGWMAGLSWGMGHGAGVLLIALAALLLRDLLPVEKISPVSQRLVGVLLIAIGFWALRKALNGRLHAHEHQHGGETHVHWHTHGARVEPHRAAEHRHTHAAVGIGALHGIAGAAHFAGVLPALAIGSRSSALVYLAGFTIGTIFGMTLFAGAVGFLRTRTGIRIDHLYRAGMGACAVAAFCVGGYWILFQ